MTLRYLESGKVTLPASTPQFVEPGHCLWCNKPLTGKAKYYCSLKEEPEEIRMYTTLSRCTIAFSHYFYSRPAYQRAIFIRDNFTCKLCGEKPMREDKPWLPDLTKLECDHILPMAHGGETFLENLQTLCFKCNREKGAKISKGMEPVSIFPLPKRNGAIFLSNGRVAWEIPSGRIAGRYLNRVYIPPDDWFVVSFNELLTWRTGDCGELRNN